MAANKIADPHVGNDQNRRGGLAGILAHRLGVADPERMVSKNGRRFSKKAMRNAICPYFGLASQALACTAPAGPAALFTLSRAICVPLRPDIAPDGGLGQRLRRTRCGGEVGHVFSHWRGRFHWIER